MLLAVTELCAAPAHKQLARQLAARLLRGDPPEGSALEPPRAVARAHRVSVSAVRRAYRTLEAEGLIERAADGSHRPRRRE